MSQMTVKQLKTALRKGLRTKLSQVQQTLINSQSDRITKQIIDKFLLGKSNQSLGIYNNMPSGEVITRGLIKYALDANHKVYLPRITNLDQFGDVKRWETQTTCLHMLEIESIDEIDAKCHDVDLGTLGSKYMITEPEFKYEKEDDDTKNPINDLLINHETGTKLDILIVPGMAFTLSGKRLGHGKGFYDDFIKRYNETYNEKPLLVGVSLLEQILDESEIIIDSHDEKLDYIITCDGVYKCT